MLVDIRLIFQTPSIFKPNNKIGLRESDGLGKSTILAYVLAFFVAAGA